MIVAASLNIAGNYRRLIEVYRAARGGRTIDDAHEGP